MPGTERAMGRSTVVAVFDERDDAKDAIDALKDAGFRADDIGLVAQNKEEAGAVAHETGTKAGQGAAPGAVAVGLLGLDVTDSSRSGVATAGYVLSVLGFVGSITVAAVVQRRGPTPT